MSIKVYGKFNEIPTDFSHREKLRPLPRVLLSILERRAGDQADIKIFNSKLYKEFVEKLDSKGMRVPSERQMRTYLSQLEKKGFISIVCDRYFNPKKSRIATVRVIRVNTVLQATGGRVIIGKGSKFTGGDPRRLLRKEIKGLILNYEFTNENFMKTLESLYGRTYRKEELRGIVDGDYFASYTRDQEFINNDTIWINASRKQKRSFLRINGNKARIEKVNKVYASDAHRIPRLQKAKEKRIDKLMNEALDRAKPLCTLEQYGAQIAKAAKWFIESKKLPKRVIDVESNPALMQAMWVVEAMKISDNDPPEKVQKRLEYYRSIGKL